MTKTKKQLVSIIDKETGITLKSYRTYEKTLAGMKAEARQHLKYAKIHYVLRIEVEY